MFKQNLYIVLILIFGCFFFVQPAPVFADENSGSDAYKRDPFSTTSELLHYIKNIQPETKLQTAELPKIRFAGSMMSNNGIMAVIEIENGTTISLKQGMKVSLLDLNDQKISFSVKKITRKEIVIIYENGVEFICRPGSTSRQAGLCPAVQILRSE